MVNTAELRPKVKKCINALDATRPIIFGHKELIERGENEDLYVPCLHGGGKDLMRILADRMDFDEGGGTYLFSAIVERARRLSSCVWQRCCGSWTARFSMWTWQNILT